VTAAGWAGWTLRRVVDLALLVALAAFAGLVVGPHVLGYRTATMLTTSMAPGIDRGDVVVDTALPVAEIAPGMVITYHIPVGDQRVVSHRVLSADVGPDGSVTVQTRGDANEAADPWTATFAAGDTAWQVRMVVPGVGHAIRVLRTPVLSTALVVGVPLLLAAWVVVGVWRPVGEEA
jgi:signal peptidase